MHRTLIGVIAVAALAVVASFDSYQRSAELASKMPDRYGVAGAELRFASIAAKLPSNGFIGYISDMPLGEQRGDMALLDARHALAPRWLMAADSPAANYEWAIGNFSKPVDYAAAGARAGYTLAEDLGNGVILYRKSKP